MESKSSPIITANTGEGITADSYCRLATKLGSKLWLGKSRPNQYRERNIASYGISTPDISSQISNNLSWRAISRPCGFGSRGLR
jgi:hypothetical protein